MKSLNMESNSVSRESSCTSPNVDNANKSPTASSSEITQILHLKTDEPSKDKALEQSVLPTTLLSSKLPNSDAEFAAIMGLLDTNDFDSLKEVRLFDL